MKITAIHAAGSLAQDLAHAQSAASAAGFIVIPSFHGPVDLIASIQALLTAASDVLQTLEIVAHGDPVSLDGINAAGAPAFGTQLRSLALSDICEIYLSGCNTAINLSGRDSLAQLISAHGPTVAQDAVRLTVYGTVGFVMGLHLDGTERTVGNRAGAGTQAKPPISLAGYPDAPDSRGGPAVNIGSITALGDASWRAYCEGRRVK